MKKLAVLFFALSSIASVTWANKSITYPNNILAVTNPIPNNIIKNKKTSDLGAPPITNLYIASVVSSTVPDGEVITPGQFITKKHHGGDQIQVNIIEIGYGANILATMNGNLLPVSSMVNVVALCQKRDGSGIGPCERGELVAGYRRTWSVSGYGNGDFTYQITSSNYPNNTKMTKIYIQ